MIDTNITRIGNSLYVLIPSDVAEYFGLDNGTPAEIEIQESMVIVRIRNAVRKKD